MEAILSVGIDLGGTSIRLGIYDGQSMIAESSMPTMVSEGPEAAICAISASLKQLQRQEGIAADTLAGVGIGSPGPINLREGVLGVLPNLPGWEHFPLRQRLQEATGLPVMLESDANAAAFAEWKRGAGAAADVDSMIMLTLGTGVGSGFLFAGRVWHGILGMGGEAGHSSIDPNGWLCSCGTRGCLEMYASANGVRRIAEQSAAHRENSTLAELLTSTAPAQVPAALSDLAENGDTGALDVYRTYGHYLGIGIANLVNTLDPPLIVLGGGVAQAWPHFSPQLFDTLEQYSIVYRLAKPTQTRHIERDRLFICPAQLGPAAGLIGAALLPRCLQEANSSF